MPATLKPQLRKQIKERLHSMPAEVAARKSRQACQNLVAMDEFGRADTIMIYLSTMGEVDTGGIALAAWQADKTVLAPRVGWEQRHMIPVEIRSLDTGLSRGPHNIFEPQEGEPWPLEDIDLIVVPALAFDRRGYRLGRGMGFYDRFLAEPAMTATAVGLGFAEQIVDELPVHEHDRPVHLLVTDQEILRFAPSGK